MVKFLFFLLVFTNLYSSTLLSKKELDVIKVEKIVANDDYLYILDK